MCFSGDEQDSDNKKFFLFMDHPAVKLKKIIKKKKLRSCHRRIRSSNFTFMLPNCRISDLLWMYLSDFEKKGVRRCWT